MWSSNFTPLNREASKQCNDSGVRLFSYVMQKLYEVCGIFAMSRVVWFGSFLIIASIWSLSTTAGLECSLSPSSKFPLVNIANRLRTHLWHHLHKRHICLLLFVILFFFRKESGTPFSSTFTCNVKTFNPRPNHVGRRFEISPIRKCIYHNFSLRVKGIGVFKRHLLKNTSNSFTTKYYMRINTKVYFITIMLMFFFSSLFFIFGGLCLNESKLKAAIFFLILKLFWQMYFSDSKTPFKRAVFLKLWYWSSVAWIHNSVLSLCNDWHCSNCVVSLFAINKKAERKT